MKKNRILPIMMMIVFCSYSQSSWRGTGDINFYVIADGSGIYVAAKSGLYKSITATSFFPVGSKKIDADINL